MNFTIPLQSLLNTHDWPRGPADEWNIHSAALTISEFFDTQSRNITITGHCPYFSLHPILFQLPGARGLGFSPTGERQPDTHHPHRPRTHHNPNSPSALSSPLRFAPSGAYSIKFRQKRRESLFCGAEISVWISRSIR